MERKKLLNLSMELGYLLMMSGAEIYRVEDSVGRLLRAYGLDSGEVFAIPNYLNVSILGEDGEPLTRIRRIPAHGTDIDLLERYNALCRTLCRDTPDYEAAMAQLRAVAGQVRPYPRWVQMAGYFVGAGFFCLFFQGGAADAVLSGVCGMVVGLCLLALGRLEANGFLKSMACSAVSAALALTFGQLWPSLHTGAIIIGAFMPLVPGVAFTTALRDIMAGDMVSGLAKAAEGVFIAVAIALGTGFAVGLMRMLFGG